MATEQIETGYWLYKGECEVPTQPKTEEVTINEVGRHDYAPASDGVCSDPQQEPIPTVFTRTEKGQALTHLEMDFNIASLLHKVEFSPAAESFIDSRSLDHTTLSANQKSKRQAEQESMSIQLHYAPIVEGENTIVQNPSVHVKVLQSTDEILEKIAEERIPGNLDIMKNLKVTGSAFIKESASVGKEVNCFNLYVSDSAYIGKDIRVEGSASIKGDVHISGSLYVDNVIYGNISREPYETPDWNQDYSRQESDERLKTNVRPIDYSLEKLKTIRGVKFNWNELSSKEGQEDVGVIAQEVQQMFPEAVDDSGEYLKVDYIKLIPLLINAVKELSWEVEGLRKYLENR